MTDRETSEVRGAHSRTVSVGSSETTNPFLSPLGKPKLTNRRQTPESQPGKYQIFKYYLGPGFKKVMLR